jgi:hypothetical protein
MRPVGRPPTVEAARQLIAVPPDPKVFEGFREEARCRGIGCQTLISDVHVTSSVQPSFNFPRRIVGPSGIDAFPNAER